MRRNNRNLSDLRRNGRNFPDLSRNGRYKSPHPRLGSNTYPNPQTLATSLNFTLPTLTFSANYLLALRFMGVIEG